MQRPCAALSLQYPLSGIAGLWVFVHFSYEHGQKICPLFQFVALPLVLIRPTGAWTFALSAQLLLVMLHGG